MTPLAASAPAASAPAGPSRLRIAIASPDILARIRQVFASRNLEVDILRMPYVEIAIRPAARMGEAADPEVIGSAARQLGGRAPVPDARAAHPLHAEYRLAVVEPGDRPEAGAAPGGGGARRRPVPGDAVPGNDPLLVLSPRQREVLALVARGVRNAEIAERLNVSEKTVKNHINRIFRSIGASSRVEAVLTWHRHEGEPG